MQDVHQQQTGRGQKAPAAAGAAGAGGKAPPTRKRKREALTYEEVRPKRVYMVRISAGS